MASRRQGTAGVLHADTPAKLQSMPLPWSLLTPNSRWINSEKAAELLSFCWLRLEEMGLAPE
jgi:hypothetical protein